MDKKVLLIIRDWWGYRSDCTNNAICETPTPNTDKIMEKYPNILIEASWEAVGLPEWYMWNSEVGHMTIGSWRIIYQSLVKINKTISDWSFFNIPEFLWAIQNCKDNNSTLHLIGLLQAEWVHSHINHVLALLDLCKKENFENVIIHAITDGRDSPVTDSIKHITTLQNKFKKLWFGKIATLNGRFYAMDRDKRRERTKASYDCIVNGITDEEYSDVITQINQSHQKEEFDEFITPKKIEWYTWIKKNDSVIFFNFRTDRTRQLTKAMVEKKFEWRTRKPLKIYFVAMTQFYDAMKWHVAFKEQNLKNILWDIISKNKMKQLRISETEKYAHVTFFFNGQNETPNKGEDRILISSPKVETYDLKPEMSAYEITDQICEQMEEDKYELIITNLVNGDMVWHTGISSAIDIAIKTVDKCVWRLVQKWLQQGYSILVTADHWNAEDQTPAWRTSHTLNEVPFILVSKENKYKLKNTWSLADIAPTILDLLELKQPEEMTGKSLIK